MLPAMISSFTLSPRQALTQLRARTDLKTTTTKRHRHRHPSLISSIASVVGNANQNAIVLTVVARLANVLVSPVSSSSARGYHEAGTAGVVSRMVSSRRVLPGSKILSGRSRQRLQRPRRHQSSWMKSSHLYQTLQMMARHIELMTQGDMLLPRMSRRPAVVTLKPQRTCKSTSGVVFGNP